MKRWVMVLMVSLGIILSRSWSAAADFNGDGTGDIAVFRSASGLWAVRGITRAYFGGGGDAVVPGDYDGDGTDGPAIFRKAAGLWAARGVTRVYFGGAIDAAMPGDYDGDGTCDAGIFRGSSGLWAARGVTRAYFGSSGDTPIDPGLIRRVTMGAGGLLKTGQTTVYRTGDDGTYRKGIAFSYTDNGDGTVTDNVTGLMWARDGNGEGCAYGATMTWSDALDWAAALTFAGHSDWRLPNRRELGSLVDTGRNLPAINPIFTNTNVATCYWTSSTVCSNPVWAWLIYFGAGYGQCVSKTNAYCVRAVRGGG